jgi:multiple sugar transport system permease protein
MEQGAMTKKPVGERILHLLAWVLLIVWGILVLFPFYWMLLTSLKGYGAYNAEYVPQFFTLSPTMENYTTAFTAVPLARYFFNTLVFTVLTTAVQNTLNVVPALFVLDRLTAGSYA